MIQEDINKIVENPADMLKFLKRLVPHIKSESSSVSYDLNKVIKEFEKRERAHTNSVPPTEEEWDEAMKWMRELNS